MAEYINQNALFAATPFEESAIEVPCFVFVPIMMNHCWSRHPRPCSRAAKRPHGIGSDFAAAVRHGNRRRPHRRTSNQASFLTAEPYTSGLQDRTDVPFFPLPETEF